MSAALANAAANAALNKKVCRHRTLELVAHRHQYSSYDSLNSCSLSDVTERQNSFNHLSCSARKSYDSNPSSQTPL